MIFKTEADVIARTYLLELEKEIDDSLCLIHEETIDKSFGWIYFYNSKEYINKDNFIYSLAGNSPFIVDKNSGKISILETADYPLFK